MGNCKDCEFWKRDSDVISQKTGSCRKYCPQMFMTTHDKSEGYHEYSTVVTSAVISRWPHTTENAGCGEFIRRGTDGGSRTTRPALKENK